MKLVVNKKANDNKGITVTEWQVFGTSAALPVDPGDPGAFLDVQQVAVRTTPGVDPTSKLPAEVWATPQDGPSIKVPVTWETVPADAYATAGTTAEVKALLLPVPMTTSKLRPVRRRPLLVSTTSSTPR